MNYGAKTMLLGNCITKNCETSAHTVFTNLVTEMWHNILSAQFQYF